MGRYKTNVYINGKRLIYLMKEDHIKSKELADEIGVSPITIQRARRNDTIDSHYLYQIAQRLNVSPLYLSDKNNNAVCYSWEEYIQATESPLDYLDKKRETGERLILSGLNYIDFHDSDNSVKNFDFKKIQDDSMNPETGSFMDYLNEQVSLWLRMNKYLH